MKKVIFETNSEGISLFKMGKMYYIGKILSESSFNQYSESSSLSYIEKVWKKSYKLF